MWIQSVDLHPLAPPVVLDTNVLVSGASRAAPSAAYQILLAILDGRVPLMLTENIAAEYEDVLCRPAVGRITGLSKTESRRLVLELISKSFEVQIRFNWRPNLLDERDNKFIEAAIASTATIVTYNLRDFGNRDLPMFGWDVMSPTAFLTLHRL